MRQLPSVCMIFLLSSIGPLTPPADANEAARRLAEEAGVEIIYGIDPGPDPIDLGAEQVTLDSNDRREIRRNVRAMIDVYAAQLGIQVAPDFAVGIDVLDDSGEFAKRYGGSNVPAGFYRHQTRKAVVSGSGKTEHIQRTAIHESSHAILGDQARRAPKWLNEGLAEYFEVLAAGAGGAEIPTQPWRRQQLARAVESDATWSVEALLQSRASQWARLRGRSLHLAYDQAWSLVSFLMEDPDRRGVVRAMLEGGGAGTNSAAAIEQHYPGGVKALDRDWRRWLDGPERSHRY